MPFTKPEIKLVVTKVYRLLYVLREWVQADVRDADRRALAQGRPPGQPLIEAAVKRVLARGLVDCQPASVAAALRRLQPFIARLVAAGDRAHALPPRPASNVSSADGLRAGSSLSSRRGGGGQGGGAGAGQEAGAGAGKGERAVLEEHLRMLSAVSSRSVGLASASGSRARV